MCRVRSSVWVCCDALSALCAAYPRGIDPTSEETLSTLVNQEVKMQNGNGIVTLLREGIIGQALIGTIVWGAIIYQITNNQPVSDALLTAGSIILGYYFRTENKNATKNGG